MNETKKPTQPPPPEPPLPTAADVTPDWTRECDNCGQKPVLPITGMCGPCTWGESSTAGGNW